MKIQVGDLAFKALLSGPPDAPVIMLHHSLATSLKIWEAFEEEARAHFRVLRYDMRGHGLSDAPQGPYDFKQLVTDITGIMDALDIDEAHHVGVSMGGMVCQHLALDAPSRVSSLTLVSTTSKMPDEAGPVWDMRIRDVIANGMEPQVEATLKRWYTKSFRDDAANRDVLEMTKELIRNTPVNGYCGWGAAIRDLDITGKLHNIDLPLTIIVGDEDPGTPVAMSQDIYQEIEGAELIVLPGLSHMLLLQDVERFNEYVLDTIDDLEDGDWPEDRDEDEDQDEGET